MISQLHYQPNLVPIFTFYVTNDDPLSLSTSNTARPTAQHVLWLDRQGYHGSSPEGVNISAIGCMKAGAVEGVEVELTGSRAFSSAMLLIEIPIYSEHLAPKNEKLEYTCVWIRVLSEPSRRLHRIRRSDSLMDLPRLSMRRTIDYPPTWNCARSVLFL